LTDQQIICPIELESSPLVKRVLPRYYLLHGNGKNPF
jgi:hypothetical protein